MKKIDLEKAEYFDILALQIAHGITPDLSECATIDGGQSDLDLDFGDLVRLSGVPVKTFAEALDRSQATMRMYISGSQKIPIALYRRGRDIALLYRAVTLGYITAETLRAGAIMQRAASELDASDAIETHSDAGAALAKRYKALVQ